MNVLQIKKYLEKAEKYFRGFSSEKWAKIRQERFKVLKKEIDDEVEKGRSFNDAAIDVMLQRVVDADAAVWVVKDLLKKLEEK